MKGFVSLERQLRLFQLPSDQLETTVCHDGCYVSAMLTPVSGGWLCVDAEPGESPLHPPRMLVLAASSDELEHAARAAIARETHVRVWSPYTTIAVLLVSLLADMNIAR